MPAKGLTPLCCLLLLALVPAGRAEDYTYVTNSGTITITRYSGPGGAVDIPHTITGLPVKAIGDVAFYACTNLTQVTIPDCVATIGQRAFASCSNLTTIALPETMSGMGIGAFQNSGLTSVTIPEGITFLNRTLFASCFALTNVNIPKSVTVIGPGAFLGCSSLVSLTIPSGVTFIGGSALSCSKLSAVYFSGNAPAYAWDAGVFAANSDPVVYYLPGTDGWSWRFDGRPTTPWFLPNPVILSWAPGFGPQPAGFGFTVSWATNASVVVEACADPTSGIWSALATNALSQGSSYFSDPDWARFPQRIYRLRER